MYDNDSSTRKSLSDILANGTAENLTKQWNATQAAGDFEPLPPGKYECHVDGGELGTSTKGHPQYTLTFRVIDGPHKGRLLWHTLYLTPAALPMAKRDLGKLGVTSLEQLENPLPGGRIRCGVTVGLRKNDDGVEYNRIRKFDLLGIDEPERDPFAPTTDAAAGTDKAERDGKAPTGDTAATDAPEPTDAASVAGGDSRFKFDATASASEAPTDTATDGGGNGSVDGNGAVASAPAATQEPEAVEGGDGGETPF